MTKRTAIRILGMVCLLAVAFFAYIIIVPSSRTTAEDRFRMRHGSRIQSVFGAVANLLYEEKNATVASIIEAAKRYHPTMDEILSGYTEVWVIADRATLMHWSEPVTNWTDPPTLLARTTDGLWIEGRMNARVKRLPSPPDTSTGWVRFK